MKDTLKLSERGKEIVKNALRKERNCTIANWAARSLVSVKTFTRFKKGDGISCQLFISICKAIGVDWEEVSESKKVNVDEFIEDCSDPLIVIAREQLISNFNNSKLKNIKAISKSFENTIKELKNSLICRNSLIDNWLDYYSVAEKNALGNNDHEHIKKYKKILQDFGEINISCASIYQAPIAVINSIKRRYQIRINLDYNYLHSPNQLANLRQHNKEHHFCFFTVAPFFLSDISTVSEFRLILPCTYNEQSLFQIPSKSKKGNKKVYIFEGSSAHAWHLAGDRIGKQKLPQEKEFIKSEEISKIIREGSLDTSSSIVIHEPLASTLSKKYSLQRMKNKTTKRWISLFAHKDMVHPKNKKILYAFLNVFIHEWNYCQADLWYSTVNIETDIYYLNVLKQGAGLSSVKNS